MTNNMQAAHAADAAQTIKTLWIKEVARFPERGPEDRLTLQPGVNVIVGVPNTGKSKWLRMIDYLFGDDNKPVEAFGEEVANKYESVQATIMVGDEEWIVERSWKEPGLISKTSVNKELMTLHAFTTKLMSALQIPILHYPQGNPYSPRTWPELGWRSLYRHMYRRQLFWTDLADRQPESEQHACILEFVGIAEVLFSEQYGKMVVLEKRIQQLQNSREQFVSMLREVSRELLDEKGLDVALTPNSITAAIKSQEATINSIQAQRQIMLNTLLEKTAKGGNTGAENPSNDLVEKLAQDLAGLRQKQEDLAVAISRTGERLAEVKKYRKLLQEELARMERAVEAGTLLADLKITNCPACDRPLEKETEQHENCILCKRPMATHKSSDSPANRLNFEVEQLKAEVKETDQLLGALVKESDHLGNDYARLQEHIGRINNQLQPVRIVAASLLPPELTVLDQETGRLHERVSQLKRVAATLEKREAIAADIEKIQGEVTALDIELSVQAKNVSFERASDLLSDGMITYLNAINELKPKSWTQQEVDFVLQDRTFIIRVGKGNWRVKLGGTLTLFFIVAYHYALMSLTGKAKCHYPGLCILDFPAQLDGITVSASENFVLEPFLRLVSQPDKLPRQVIAAGSSFSGLQGAHRIQLTNVWS